MVPTSDIRTSAEDIVRYLVDFVVVVVLDLVDHSDDIHY